MSSHPVTKPIDARFGYYPHNWYLTVGTAANGRQRVWGAPWVVHRKWLVAVACARLRQPAIDEIQAIDNSMTAEWMGRSWLPQSCCCNCRCSCYCYWCFCGFLHVQCGHQHRQQKISVASYQHNRNVTYRSSPQQLYRRRLYNSCFSHLTTAATANATLAICACVQHENNEKQFVHAVWRLDNECITSQGSSYNPSAGVTVSRVSCL